MLVNIALPYIPHLVSVFVYMALMKFGALASLLSVVQRMKGLIPPPAQISLANNLEFTEAE